MWEVLLWVVWVVFGLFGVIRAVGVIGNVDVIGYELTGVITVATLGRYGSSGLRSSCDVCSSSLHGPLFLPGAAGACRPSVVPVAPLYDARTLKQTKERVVRPAA